MEAEARQEMQTSYDSTMETCEIREGKLREFLTQQ